MTHIKMILVLRFQHEDTHIDCINCSAMLYHFEGISDAWCGVILGIDVWQVLGGICAGFGPALGRFCPLWLPRLSCGPARLRLICNHGSTPG